MACLVDSKCIKMTASIKEGVAVVVVGAVIKEDGKLDRLVDEGQASLLLIRKSSLLAMMSLK